MDRWVVSLVTIVVAMAGVPATVHAASSTVSIAVPPVQLLEGTTTITLAPGAAGYQGQLTVKSNVPWVLIARTGDAGVIWSGVAGRQQVGSQTVVAQGARGVHTVSFTLQRGSQHAGSTLAAEVAFAIEPAE